MRKLIEQMLVEVVSINSTLNIPAKVHVFVGAIGTLMTQLRIDRRAIIFVVMELTRGVMTPIIALP